MKKLTILGSVFVTAAMTTGCLTNGGIAKLVTALGKDNASVRLSVKTIYGNLDLTRANPQSTSLPSTLSPDGTVTVGGPQIVAPVSERELNREFLRRIPVPTQ